MELPRPRPLFYAVAAAILGSDQATKAWILGRLSHPGDGWAVVPGFFDLTFVTNTGIAFGLFQGRNGLLALVVMLILGLAFWMARELDWRKLEVNLLAGCVLGGAVGNLVDRLRFGYVVDFLDFNLGFMRWPAFNIADAAISCSVVWILCRILVQEIRPRQAVD
ncbi:MAG: signal peptidase II [Candidatus Methylacidiphilales bacterium]|nr:signal peptidase II [Candidatus Methylacidiphilales bacterium]